MTDDEPELADKVCPICGWSGPDREDLGENRRHELLVDALRHMRRRHPKSDHYRDIVDGYGVTAVCVGCVSEFAAETSIASDGTLGRRAFCEDCIEEEPLRELYSIEMTDHDVVKGRSEIPPHIEMEARTDD